MAVEERAEIGTKSEKRELSLGEGAGAEGMARGAEKQDGNGKAVPKGFWVGAGGQGLAHQLTLGKVPVQTLRSWSYGSDPHIFVQNPPRTRLKPETFLISVISVSLELEEFPLQGWERRSSEDKL